MHQRGQRAPHFGGVGTLFFGSLPLFGRGSFLGISRPGRIFVTAEDALPPAATGRRRFGLFFRSFAGVVTGEGPTRDAAPTSVGTLEGGV